MELISNNGVSTLNGGINSSVTSLVVTLATSFPSTGNFRILIDSEIMLVTAVSGTTFTVTRGLEGTTAASHSSGATVTLILTAGSLKKYIEEHTSQIGAWTSKPAAGVQGNLYFSNDGPLFARDNGSSYDVFRTERLIVPTASMFSWINQKSSGTQATVTDTAAGLYIYGPPDSADAYSFQTINAPATPYSVIIHAKSFIVTTNYMGTAFGFYESSSGSIKIMYFDTEGGTSYLGVGHGTGASPHLTANYQQWQVYDRYEWMKIRDDGTNTIFYVSVDGVNWVEVYRNGRTTDMIADKIVFGVNPRNGISAPCAMLVDSFEITG